MELWEKESRRILGLLHIDRQITPNWANLQRGQPGVSTYTQQPIHPVALSYVGDFTVHSSATRLMVFLFSYYKLFIYIP